MKLMTIKEVARLLKINEHTAYRYAKDGRIPATRVGRNWRVLEEVLETWLKERSGKTMGAWKRRKPVKK